MVEGFSVIDSYLIIVFQILCILSEIIFLLRKKQQKFFRMNQIIHLNYVIILWAKYNKQINAI